MNLKEELNELKRAKWLLSGGAYTLKTVLKNQCPGNEATLYGNRLKRAIERAEKSYELVHNLIKQIK